MNYEVYCDESCFEALSDKTSHTHIGIGGIWLPSNYRNEFKDGINQIKRKYLIKGEIKWNKISPSYFEFYKEIIDYFFESEFLRFRVIIIESAIVNNILYHDSDSELSFYKFYYQLLHHWILDFNEYSIFLDYKLNKNKSRITILKTVLQNANLTSKIKTVQALPSCESVGIQLADILTGLVTAKFNNKNTSNAKKNLIDYIEKSKLKREISHTTKSNEKFNVFKINLSGGW